MGYRLITGKQYQKALTRDSRCFQRVKINLFKFHLSLKSCRVAQVRTVGSSKIGIFKSLLIYKRSSLHIKSGI